MTGPQDEPQDRPSDPDVGSLGEEAAKLLGALSGWASEHVGEVNEHLATGSAECTYCPVCRTVHALRNANPEVRAQLATAAQTFLQAAAGLLATAAQSAGQSTGQSPGAGVQRIDLGGPEDPDDPQEEQP